MCSFRGSTSLSDCTLQQCQASSMVAGMMTFCFLLYRHQEQYKRRALIVSDSIGIEKLIVWMCWRCISSAASLYYYRRQSATWLAFSLHTVIIIKELLEICYSFPACNLHWCYCSQLTYFIFNIIILWWNLLGVFIIMELHITWWTKFHASENPTPFAAT